MESTKPQRLLSLDIFRGITIAGMILVNNPGSWKDIYPALEHAKWHGVTPTDLIFPFFLFIVGVAITFALSKRKEKGENQTKIIIQIIRRGATLFLLGLVLASLGFWYGLLPWFPSGTLSNIRIPGVLQRIGVVYIIASILFLKTAPRTRTYLAFAILLIYWGLMTLVPVPGVGYPNLEPATNLGAWLDNLLLNGHLWAATKVWDPEGILSTLPAISTALFGIMTGEWIRSKNDDTTKVVWMFVWGNIALVVSMIWDMWFPINKSLWTSSYVIYTAGMALQFFAMCYYLVDVKGIKWWTKPFIVYGMNAITVFFLSGALGRLLGLIKVMGPNGEMVGLSQYFYLTCITPFFSPMNASMIFALIYVTFWLGLMWILYVKKIFIKV